MKSIIAKVLYVLAFLVIVSTLALFWIHLERQATARLRAEGAKRVEALRKLDSCEAVVVRRHRMAKAMTLSYDISDVEASYYAGVFDEFATRYNVPWEVYAATIRVESNFRTTLKSAKGAKGLTQVLEGTAKPICEKLGIRFVAEETLWNDYINLVVGLTFLSENIAKDTVGGDAAVQHGIQCYIGGPDYLTSIKYNAEASKYIAQYKTTIWAEYVRLRYIYRGVIQEEGGE